MLSLDLFDSKYEKKLHEGAVDDAEFARLNDLRKKIKVLDLAREKTKDPEMHRAIDDRKKVYADEIKDILSVRGMKEAEQPAQPPAKGLVKGKDLVTPQQRVAGATPAKPGVAGAVKDVAGGIKRWLQGKPDQGPTYEAYTDPAGQVSPRATGNANMGLLIKANSFKQVAPVTFEFPNMAPVPLTAQQTEVLSDYYDGLADSGGQNHFIYNVLSSYQELDRLMNKLGAPLKAQVELLPAEPGAQGQLPLQEKKKSKEDDLEAGDIKVARELQKLRAEYPAARSDVEAVARAEIDSTERSQRQLTAIRGANEKQDALLKQLVDLDQQQGREIDGLDKENNSLEQRLAQIQATNDRLQQTIGKMTGTKKSATTVAPARPSTSDAARSGIIDVGTPVTSIAKAEPETQPTSKQRGPEVFQQMTRTITAPKNVSSLKAYRTQEPENDAEYRLTGTEESVKEHGGGIGPKKYWQSMMPETALNPQDPQGDYEAKRRALHDLSLNKDVDQQAVLQRRLDLDREAKAKGLAETVTNVKAGMAEIYRRLAPKIERYRDSFLAGQLYDELENYAELHGAEGEFKRMMSTARNRAHMEYDTNPGGFHNWFWFLPFEDEQLEEISRRDFLKGAGVAAVAGAGGYIAGTQNQLDKRIGHNLGRLYGFMHNANTFSQRSYKLNAINDRLKYFEKRLDPDIDRTDWYKYGFDQGQREYKRIFPNGHTSNPADESKFDELLNAYFKNFAESAYGGLKEEEVDEAATDDIKKRMSKLEALALAANRAGDDAKCKMYQQKIQSLKQKLSQSMAEGWSDQGNPTAYSVYIDGREWRAYKSDEQARRVADKVQANLKLQGRDQTVTIAPSKTKRVQENISREPRTARERDDMIDKIRRMMTQDRNPANLQIMKKDIEILQTKYRDLKEDSGSGEAVEMAIMRRMLVAHTDLIVEFGLDKVVQAIEEVAYNVGDTDEIGSSDVSGWVRQVERMLGVDA